MLEYAELQTACPQKNLLASIEATGPAATFPWGNFIMIIVTQVHHESPPLLALEIAGMIGFYAQSELRCTPALLEDVERKQKLRGTQSPRGSEPPERAKAEPSLVSLQHWQDVRRHVLEALTKRCVRPPPTIECACRR